jgi:hypothetical protein
MGSYFLSLSISLSLSLFLSFYLRTLAIFDNTGDKKLDKEELKCGLQDYGIQLNIRELDEIFGYFGKFLASSLFLFY